jgi:hypothetical protein
MEKKGLTRRFWPCYLLLSGLIQSLIWWGYRDHRRKSTRKKLAAPFKQKTRSFLLFRGAFVLLHINLSLCVQPVFQFMARNKIAPLCAIIGCLSNQLISFFVRDFRRNWGGSSFIFFGFGSFGAGRFSFVNFCGDFSTGRKRHCVWLGGCFF